MRIVIQRVRHALLSIGGHEYSSIGEGMVVLVGVEERDTIDDVEWLVKKTAQLRIYNDENGVMNRSLLDIGGNALVVSQFTLHASVKKVTDRLIFGRRVPNMRDPFMRLFANVCRKHWGER